ncbi:succinate dehydrogenase, hydrophobic membrane anchor protein [Phenylobacterium sp.]|uniref:succinate dehydrogenase, hydrophobic membrane anchor protein n=1 Tax=Phenylobacterium sp. TaxID=1871053 RepID=UPI0025ED455B|nr:succinate dehydrogenase, hydrophobic membrane anchor protein [Phenylobacterium sp.]
MTDFRTPLSRARGSGAAGHGAAHWVAERVSAIALIPLSLWMVYAALVVSRTGYSGAVAFLANPVNAVLVVLVLVVSGWHMHAGARVIIEDYMHRILGRSALLVLNLFVAVLATALAVFSVLKVALGGAL